MDDGEYEHLWQVVALGSSRASYIYVATGLLAAVLYHRSTCSLPLFAVVQVIRCTAWQAHTHRYGRYQR